MISNLSRKEALAALAGMRLVTREQNLRIEGLQRAVEKTRIAAGLLLILLNQIGPPSPWSFASAGKALVLAVLIFMPPISRLRIRMPRTIWLHCDDCDGSGALDGKEIQVVCPTCGGSGRAPETLTEEELGSVDRFFQKN